MSNKFFNNKNTDTEGESLARAFVSRLQNISLTDTESENMRLNLIAYSNMHSIPEDARPVVSPYSFKYLSAYFSSYPRTIIATTLIALILISGTGISYAAEDTLPGQPLYAVKVAVVEPIQGALITNTTDKAKWQTELAGRRLTEASTLAVQNKLATSTQEYLSQAVETHVALAQQDANQLSASGNDSSALNVRSDLEAQLSAHADFLSVLTPRLKDVGDASTTVVAVTALLHTVESSRSEVEISRKATEVALGAMATASSTPADSASTTPAEAQVIAYVDAQNSARHTEENTLFSKSAKLLSLLPAAPADLATTSDAEASTTTATASTTDTTTIGIPDVNNTGDTGSTTQTQVFPLYRHHIHHSN